MIDTFQHRGSKNELPVLKFRLVCIVYCVTQQKVYSCFIYIAIYIYIQLYINLVVTAPFSKISYNNNNNNNNTILKIWESSMYRGDDKFLARIDNSYMKIKYISCFHPSKGSWESAASIRRILFDLSSRLASNDTIDSVLRHWEVGRAKNLSALR